MIGADIEPSVTGEGWLATYMGGRKRPQRHDIARLAFAFYEARGRQHGHDVDDWPSAEQALTRDSWTPRKAGVS